MEWDVVWWSYVFVESLGDLWMRTWEWLQGMDGFRVLLVFWGTLLLDVPRYLLTDLVILSREFFKERPKQRQQQPWWGDRPPLVSVILSTHNEKETILLTLRSLFEQTYPNLEIVVVDDGSTDGTHEVCRPLAGRGLIRLLRTPCRMGKSSAVNMAARVARGSFMVILDSDCTLDREAIQRALTRFSDPSVGGVSCNVRVRNGRGSIIRRMQEIEYLLSINLGRRFTSGTDTLFIISGVFGVMRKDIYERLEGMDIGPAEDLDLTIKIRKTGFKVRFAPDAVCYSNVPASLGGFVRQRLRWERGIVTIPLRKHRNIAHIRWSDRNFSSFAGWCDIFLFQFLLPCILPIYFMYMMIFYPQLLVSILLITYLAYTLITWINLGLILVFLSDRPREDMRSLLYGPLYPLYQLFLMKPLQVVSFVQEILFRLSYRDPYVPSRILRESVRW
jgi:cellulose synthase/poly-beta-1,6-N-acetylglucosamine synthase-like glycosyltransferase